MNAKTNETHELLILFHAYKMQQISWLVISLASQNLHTLIHTSIYLCNVGRMKNAKERAIESERERPRQNYKHWKQCSTFCCYSCVVMCCHLTWCVFMDVIEMFFKNFFILLSVRINGETEATPAFILWNWKSERERE